MNPTVTYANAHESESAQDEDSIEDEDQSAICAQDQEPKETIIMADKNKKTEPAKNPNKPPRPPATIGASAAESPAKKLAAAVSKLAKRVQSAAERLRETGGGDDETDARAALLKAATGITATAQVIASLGASWRPAGGGAGNKAVWAPGTKVQIVKSWRGAYDGFLTSDEMVALVLVKIVDKKAVVKTEQGRELFTRLQHIGER